MSPDVLALIGLVGVNLIYIVSGPTCAGKSTLISSPEISDLTGMPAKSPVIFPSSIAADPKSLRDNCLVHYNILRHADETLQNRPGQRFSGYCDFRLDPAWAFILSHPSPKCAFVLKVSRTILMERMAQRRHIESKSIISSFINRYPRQHWLQILEQIDLDMMYQAWCAELEENGIPYITIDSSNELYRILDTQLPIQPEVIQYLAGNIPLHK